MIYDISQEVFSCNVFPGDPSPEAERMLSIKNGDVCNLTKISMCAHNGTHVDAPYHFLNDGKTLSFFRVEIHLKETGEILADGDFTFFCTSEA